MRAYFTGGTGFVGGGSAPPLHDCGDEVAPGPEMDVTVPPYRAGLRLAAPEVVFHLAALTHVGRSWPDPAETFQVNAFGTNLLVAAAVRRPAGGRHRQLGRGLRPGARRETLDEQAELRPADSPMP